MRGVEDASRVAADGSPAVDGSRASDGTSLDAPPPDAWLPSPTTNASCEPNCDATDCGVSCMQGMPCDNGCCPANAIAPELVAHYRTVPLMDGTRVVVDSDGGLHYAYLDTELYYYENGSAGWVGGAVDTAGFANQIGVTAAFLRLALGRSGGSDVAYVSYRLLPVNTSPAIESGRFGVKRGATWTFETLPGLPRALAVEPSGVPLVLTNDKVLRRNSAGGWDEIALPAIADTYPDDITTDQAGTLYLESASSLPLSVQPVWVSRRSPSGTWSSEVAATTYGGSGRIIAAAGTVHVGIHAADGTYYARRVGGSWTQHYVAPPANEVSMAIDGCGSPHFVLAGESGAPHDNRYYRWTSQGWRSSDIPVSSCGAGDGVDIAVTSSTALISDFDCAFLLASVPLK